MVAFFNMNIEDQMRLKIVELQMALTKLIEVQQKTLRNLEVAISLSRELKECIRDEA
jgi:hypothetical protein